MCQKTFDSDKCQYGKIPLIPNKLYAMLIRTNVLLEENLKMLGVSQIHLQM